MLRQGRSSASPDDLRSTGRSGARSRVRGAIRWLDALLEGSSATVVVLAVLLLALVVGFDVASGPEASVLLFYLLPIAILTWYMGPFAGVVMSFATTGIRFIHEVDLRTRHGLHPAIPYWNSAVRLGFFLAFTAVLAALRTSMMREREASRFKSEMLSLVSHEFKNALMSMGTALLVLEQTEGKNEAPLRERMYAAIDRAQKTLGRAVDNFLGQARLGSGTYVVELGPLDLRGAVQDALALLAPLGDQKKLDVVLQHPTEIPLVAADRDAITLVMTNIIGNAIKYSPVGGRVTVRLERAPAPQARTTVSVEDEGPGIPIEQRQAIFNWFYRVRPETPQRHPTMGFGIGLQVSRALVESHHGHLVVGGDPGKGARFSFDLEDWSPVGAEATS